MRRRIAVAVAFGACVPACFALFPLDDYGPPGDDAASDAADAALFDAQADADAADASKACAFEAGSYLQHGTFDGGTSCGAGTLPDRTITVAGDGTPDAGGPCTSSYDTGCTLHIDCVRMPTTSLTDEQHTNVKTNLTGTHESKSTQNGTLASDCFWSIIWTKQ